MTKEACQRHDDQTNDLWLDPGLKKTNQPNKKQLLEKSLRKMNAYRIPLEEHAIIISLGTPNSLWVEVAL